MDQLLRFFLSNCRLACCIAIEGAGGGMEGGGSYNQSDAEGFLRIIGLPSRVQGRVNPREY